MTYTGPRSLAPTVAKIARAALGRDGMTAATLLTHWAEIVGPELAEVTLPEKLSRPTGKSASAAGGVLTVRVSGGAAMELQHLAPVVIERINGFLGVAAVRALKLLHAPLPVAPAPLRPRPRSLSDREAEAIAATLDDVESPDLKAALSRLGHSLAAQNRGPGEA